MSLLEYSCKICSSEAKDVDPAVLCDRCENWIHADNCAIIGETQYGNPKESPLPCFCPYCAMELPFSSIKNKGLQILHNGSSHK